MKYVTSTSVYLRTVLFIACVAIGSQVSGQPVLPELLKGVPRIIHYTKKEFNADPQFWAMCQDKDGILYFGNNDGTLVFDGERWQKVFLPNKSSVRSLRVNERGEVFAGGYNEFGIIKKDEFGTYYYESLIPMLRQEDRNLENIWQIHDVNGYTVFRSAKKLVALANNKAVTIPTPQAYIYSTVVKGQLYVLDNEGVKVLKLKSMEFSNSFNRKEISYEDPVSLLPGFNDRGLLIITRQGGVYSMEEENGAIKLVKRLLPANSSNFLLNAIKASNGSYYIGTLSTKVIVLDATGKPFAGNEAFQHLQDNTVLNLFESKDGNIWTLLNNGIDCIDLASPMSVVFENAALFDVLQTRDKVYLATNQGVFVSHQSDEGVSSFKSIKGLEGQAWSLQFINGQVICSHDRGVFFTDGTQVKRLPSLYGVWKIIPVKGKPDYYFACTYNTIYVLQYSPTKGLVVKNRLEGFDESGRDILQGDEPGVFWICHGYKGVFRIKVTDDLTRVVSLEHFKDQNGLPTPFGVNVFRWKNEIVFTSDQGIYTFDKTTNRFQPHVFLTALFGTRLNVRKLVQQGDKTWFVHDDEAGYFITDAARPVLQKGLFMGLKGTFNQGMECVVPIGNEQVLLGTNTGLYSFDLQRPLTMSSMARTLIVSVKYIEKGKEQHARLMASSDLQLPIETSSVRFDFAALDFLDKQNIQYSYLLEDADEGWSVWGGRPFQEYNYLRPGYYVFRVKARSSLGEYSAETVYQFQILPAWYETVWAYMIYVIFAVLLFVTVVIMVNRKIQLEKQKTREEEEKKRKVLELELQQIRLQQEREQILKDKEQLEEDVIYKSKELANYTMLLVKKRELLTEIHDDLKVVKESIKQEAPRKMVHDLTKKIATDLQSEEHIHVFEANFERVHHEFFTQLKATFADLTQKELQLCAFVRMNLTNKEIATILNISVRGVETARYRLRKRLGIGHEQDMTAFLERLHSSNEKPEGEGEEALPTA